MITEDQIKRINELYKKQKEGTLTDEEKVEQANLRGAYIEAIRNNIKATLNNTVIDYDDGTSVDLGEKYASKDKKD